MPADRHESIEDALAEHDDELVADLRKIVEETMPDSTAIEREVAVVVAATFFEPPSHFLPRGARTRKSAITWS